MNTPPAPAALHQCAAPNCNGKIKNTRLFCYRHWHALPEQWHVAISKAQRDAKRGRLGDVLLARSVKREAIAVLCAAEGIKP